MGKAAFMLLPENHEDLHAAQNDKLGSNTSFRWARNIDRTSNAGMDMHRDDSYPPSASHQENTSTPKQSTRGSSDWFWSMSSCLRSKKKWY